MNKYNWDLEYLLKNDTLENLFKKWKNGLDKLVIDNPTFSDTKENFVKRLKDELKHHKISNHLVNYISNHLNEDTKNQKWIEWSQKLSNEINEFSKNTSDTSNIVLKNEKKIREYLKDPDLHEYVRDYEIFFKNKKRILPEEQEKLVANLSTINDGFENIYSAIVDSTIKYEPAKDKNGKLIQISSMAKAIKLFKSTDVVLRKNAWVNFSKAYYDNRLVLTQTLLYNYKMLNVNSKIRKFSSYVEMTAENDEVTIDFINKIYSGVEDFKDSYKNYLNIKEKLLKSNNNLKKVMPWDRYLDVVKSKQKYSIEEIQKEILESLKCFGSEYLEIVQKAFDENWISWLPKDGKHSGAYSIGGTYGIEKYYISMNFDETIDSLYTAIHEIGHSMNSYYFGKKQKVHCSCSIFYAEISSITNELILSFHLLEKAKNKKEKLFVIDKILSGFFSTTSRQIIFSDFENEIINRDLNNEPITYDVIEETYRNINEKYTGIKKNKKQTIYGKYSSATILRIDHFYVGNFYVYKYAIGQICAMYIARKLYMKDKVMLEKYFNFVSSGSSLSPLDTIKLLGIDFNDEKVWDECKDNIDFFIKEYKNLSNIK